MKAIQHTTTRIASHLRLSLIAVMLFSFIGSMNLSSYNLSLPVTGDQPIRLTYPEAALPGLDEFAGVLFTGDETQIVGIYADEALALPVIQQPENSPNFVSPEDNTATQFKTAEDYGTIGLLAHNYLAGEQFFGLAPDQILVIVRGDGSLDYYQISEIRHFQALMPDSPQSNFVDLNGDSEVLSAVDVFNQVYAPGDRLVLQTCIALGDKPSWGRLFIIATPLINQVHLEHLAIAV